MRVLRISHSAAVDEWRGRERALTQLGLDVTLLAAPTEDVGGHTVALDPRPEEKVRPVGRIGTHPALFVYNPVPLWRALGEEWDVIDIHEEPFALATAEILLIRLLRRKRSPVVLYTAQNIDKRYPPPFRWFERWALRTASGISACNTEAARIVERKGFAGRARVIPLGVDLTRFTALPSVAEAEPRSETITVGFLGRLVPEKGIDVLWDAAALDERLALRVAGSGPALDDLRARAESLGIADRVTMRGALDPDHVRDFYRGLDVVAIPSLTTARWTEQFGRVAIEAMACGVPVVSSDAGALPDVVGGAGIVVAQGDAAALATALVDAAGPRAEGLRHAGLKRAEECSWDAVGVRYLDLYRAVLHRENEHRESEPRENSDVEVIVVAYGQVDLLRRALEPVAGMAVTVVDNSSLPEIAHLCAELGVRYLDAGHNRGFGAGVNLALADRRAPGADVLLLNPDAHATPADIGALQRALRSNPDVASVAPAQTDTAGIRGQVTWIFPSPARSWLEAIGLSRLRRGPTFVIGAVLLLRAEALAQVGGFDERFFLYAEETDWAYRAHLTGWRHVEVTGIRAVHEGAGTSTDEVHREALFHASQERYFRKHFGAVGWQFARAAAWTGSALRGLLLKDDRAAMARRRAQLYWRGPIAVETAQRSGTAAR